MMHYITPRSVQHHLHQTKMITKFIIKLKLHINIEIIQQYVHTACRCINIGYNSGIYVIASTAYITLRKTLFTYLLGAFIQMPNYTN